MATVVPTDEALKAMTAAQILELWKAAMVDGLGTGATFSDEITKPGGEIATHLLGTIKAELERRAAMTPPKHFDQDAFLASTRVARDTGAICRIMANKKTSDGKLLVTLDVFQKVRLLTKAHPACPEVLPAGATGTGPFC